MATVFKEAEKTQFPLNGDDLDLPTVTMDELKRRVEAADNGTTKGLTRQEAADQIRRRFPYLT